MVNETTFVPPRSPPADPPMPVRTVRGPVSSRSLPESPDLSAARGKGGCWTCRLRRKKCDEQRENGSCQTCLRLKIDCLGWGVRRPDWMRDKAQVEAYKAGIKRQLSSQGMIRGQPRTPVISTGPNMSPLQYQYPITHGGLPLIGDSDETDEYFDHTSANASPSYPSIQMPQLATGRGMLGLDLQIYPNSAGPHTPPALAPHYLNTSPHTIGGNLPMIPFSVPSQSYYEQPQQQLNSPPLSNDTRQQLVLYYFRRVRQIQFIFAGPGVTSVLHDLIVREPAGVVADAVCALAALHKSQVRVAEGLENPAAENSFYAHSKKCYDQAWWKLLDARQRNGRYAEQEATAAIHLVSYWIFCGGGGEWQAPLTVASDWLAESTLMGAANVRLQWLQLSSSAKFTAQMTMWLDIFSAIDTGRAPRFMDLYRRLFRVDQSYWTGSPQGGHVHDLQMDALTACPDAVMHALAETAHLAHWKAAQQGRHSLSVRELLARADAVEQELRGSWGVASPEAFPHLLEQAQPQYELGGSGGGGGGGVPPPSRTSSGSSLPSAHASPVHPAADLVPASTAVSTPEPTIGAETRRLVGRVFFEAALLYLRSVVNDHNPGVAEIAEGVNATVQALNKLALSEVDRGLVFPICLAGCLTDVPAHREFFTQRLDAQSTTLGNLAETRRLMDVVWQRRDTQGGVVDWRQLMPDIGMNLLVV